MASVLKAGWLGATDATCVTISQDTVLYGKRAEVQRRSVTFLRLPRELVAELGFKHEQLDYRNWVSPVGRGENSTCRETKISPWSISLGGRQSMHPLYLGRFSVGQTFTFLDISGGMRDVLANQHSGVQEEL